MRVSPEALVKGVWFIFACPEAMTCTTLLWTRAARWAGITQIKRILADDPGKAFLPDSKQGGIRVGEATLQIESAYQIGKI
jgi:hypothetical protein